jgi:DnaJ-like protein
MSDWESRFESYVDRRIREAEERGEFDDLPGTGKPLPGIDRPPSADWWLKKLMEREKLGIHALPPALALRKEAQELMATLSERWSEAAVRDAVEDYNRRAAKVRRDPQIGSSVTVDLLDADKAVAVWRARKQAG